MRAIALILVLANLALFAWQHWLQAPVELTPPLADSLPGLVLLTEVGVAAPAAAPPVEVAPVVDEVVAEPTAVGDTDSETQGEQPGTAVDPPFAEQDPEVSVPTAPGAPEMVCRSVGPFTSQAEARRAAAMLAETGRVPLQRVTEGEVWLGYWVYIQPFASAEEADEVAQALERALVEDFYIIRDGELANAISLGVYSQQAGAEARLSEMRTRGFPAEMTDRYRSAPVYWLDFAEAADDPISLSLLMPAAPGRVLRAETGDCALP